jgi:16S rRNA (adenine1518-N6/adenine1519-N6)-dimethyltransferase
MAPKKSLGQNFLTSPAIAGQIVLASGAKKTDTVLEIGPGKGILTHALAKVIKQVIAIEKDTELASIDFGKNVKVIEGDIRKINIESLNLPKNYLLVANIPYYITGEIIRMFLSAKNQPQSMTLLVQKEVAQRIIAQDGKESVLSLSVRAYGEPEYVRTVRAGVFFPKPKVDSAILHIKNISRKNFKNVKEEERFFTLIKTAFNSKRKKIGGTLKELLTVLPEWQDARPETVPLKTWLSFLN